MPEIIENELPRARQSVQVETNIFEVIKNRRAIRNYLPKQVSKELIRSLIDYAILAPSAMNLQPWSFVVIQNVKLLKEFSDEVKRQLFANSDFSKESGEYGVNFLDDPEFDIFHGASTLIVICAKEKMHKEFNTESDCFLAGENLMLAATGMGLATCPIGLAIDFLCQDSLGKKLEIPEFFKPVLPIVVGHAGDHPGYIGRIPPVIKWVG